MHLVRDLLPHLLALDTAATNVGDWDRDAAVRTLSDVVDFLRGHLVPHAAAEEEVLYPAVEEAMAACESVITDYARHCQAARDLAEACFDSDRVIRRILMETGQECAGRAPNSRSRCFTTHP